MSVEVDVGVHQRHNQHHHHHHNKNEVLSPSNSEGDHIVENGRQVSNKVLAMINVAGGWVFGYNCGAISGAATSLGLVYPSMESWVSGLLTSSIVIGAMFGSILGGPFADRYGRRAGLILVAVTGLVLSVVLAASMGLPMIIVIRGLLGIPVGLSSAICPMYVSESAPVSRRGFLGTFFQLGICFSIFVAYCMTPAFDTSREGWRYIFGLGAPPAIVLGLLAWSVPESPMWAGGKKVIAVDEEYLLLSTNASAPRSAKMPLKAALMIGIVLAVANQLTGINAFMFYSVPIFQSAGVEQAVYATMGLGFWNFATALIATFFVDRLGRRPLILGGTMVMAASCILLGLVTLIHQDASVKGALSVVLLFIFIAAFESGDGPLFWVTLQELFPEEHKTFGATTLNATQWCFNILLSFGFPVLSKAIGQAACFYIFGAIGVACSVILFFALPETKAHK